MWVVRELARLLVRVVIAVAVALVLAVLWAALSDRGWTQSLRATCLGVGCLAILMGAVGRGSNLERAMDYRVAERAWGRIPGMSTLQPRGEDPTLSAGAVFFLTGVALIVLGTLVL
jgi:cell division protein FtsW (lipid II flippase)